MNSTNSDIASPCLNVCKLDTAKTICIGCFRTLSEIGEWSRATDRRKQQIVDEAAKRKQVAEA